MPQAGMHGLVGMAVRKMVGKKEWLVLGLILGKEYEYTGDLFAPTFSHFFYNLVIVFFLFIG